MGYIGPGEPFGDIGSEVGGYAADLLYYLSLPLENVKPTQVEKPDYLALTSLCDLEDMRRLIVAEHPSVIGVGQARLDRLWTEFHTALPFSEGERVWLLGTCSQRATFSSEMPGVISDQEGSIVTSGLRRRVSGRDLMRRWFAWRREAEEYSDQGTLGIARDALAGLIGLLHPKEVLPEAYLELKREGGATP